MKDQTGNLPTRLRSDDHNTNLFRLATRTRLIEFFMEGGLHMGDNIGLIQLKRGSGADSAPGKLTDTTKKSVCAASGQRRQYEN